MSSTTFRLPSIRYILIALFVILSTHYIVSLSSPSYASNTSLTSVKTKLSNNAAWASKNLPFSNSAARVDTNTGAGRSSSTTTKQRVVPVGNAASAGSKNVVTPSTTVDGGARNMTRANAAFVVLARNSDVWEILISIRGMEDRFNKNYNYPYVFLNDEPFSEDFKARTSALASGKCTYGLIPKEVWEEPSWIDEERAKKTRDEMVKADVIYGGSATYRRMCRYQSGGFYEHDLLANFKYYWRIEPSVKYFCDVGYDPFLFMQENKKKYGWIITLPEYEKTIPTLWEETKKYIKENPQVLAKPNLMEFISEDGGETYNRCHFWSNFEIGDLDFYRSEAYRGYFQHLDKAGGFSYERWGDAPVHSIAAALFLKPEELHFFSDMGYRHEPFQHCPTNRLDACACDPRDGNNFENHGYSCTPRYKKVSGWKAINKETEYIEPK